MAAEQYKTAGSMDASESVLRQLRWIKWLTALLALSFATIAATFIWIAVEATSAFTSAKQGESFADRAADLLDEGKAVEVLSLTAAREKKYPKEPDVYWYRGKAYYQLGRYPEALEAMRQVHDMAPTWRKEHTGPYIQAIGEKLAAKP